MNHIKAGDVTIGGLIREYRTAARLTQEELSERAEISVRAVRNLELGLVRSPRRSTLQRLAVALGLAEEETARFIEIARYSTTSSASLELSGVEVFSKSPVPDCLVTLFEQLANLERVANRSATTVLVIQMIVSRAGGSSEPVSVELFRGRPIDSASSNWRRHAPCI
jgi:transcriptional regulator with XRE-family HTH domain